MDGSTWNHATELAIIVACIVYVLVTIAGLMRRP